MSDQGFNGKTPIWYFFGKSPFRHVTPVRDFRQIKHNGWFADIHCDNTIFGIIGSLTHGRYVAGYQVSDSGEQVFYGEIFTDKNDAVLMADEHARIYAEIELEHNQRFNDALALESDIETAYSRLKECIVLRHVACMDYVRSEISDLIETIRDKRETLQNDFAGVL